MDRITGKRIYRCTWAIEKWEYVTRPNDAGHVSIMGIIPGDTPRLVVVKQFRPPLDAWILELPAGQIDRDETIAEAACRELAEETDYLGKVVGAGPFSYNSPGLTTEHVSLVHMTVTGKTPPRPEADEQIEVLELDLHNLQQELKVHHQQGMRIDAKLWCLAQGIQLSIIRR